jgi:hypothetical protein
MFRVAYGWKWYLCKPLMSQIIRTLFSFALLIHLVSCAPSSPTSPRNSIVIDTGLIATAKARIRFHNNRYFSSFRTEVNAEFYTDGKLKETIKDTNYSVTSWYNYYKDTMTLVAHIGVLNTSALLLKFTQDSILVYYYACGHTEDRKIYKLHMNDELGQCVEVPPSAYKLSLSGIPDTLTKPIIYGYVDMVSNDYYHQPRPKSLVKCRTSMRFYFRSQIQKI